LSSIFSGVCVEWTGDYNADAQEFYSSVERLAVIVGRGLLARAFSSVFAESDDWMIFASGVSNSSESNSAEFLREETLLRSCGEKADGALVYFSSCGLIDGDTADTPYMRHKRRMESLVLSMPRSIVLRLPQVVGRTGNTHTLINYLRDRIVSGEHFTIWKNAERNIIDIDDVVAIAEELLRHPSADSRVINIAVERSSLMTDIVKIVEDVIGKRGNYTLEAKGAPLRLNTVLANEAARRLGLDMGAGYLERVITKYYALPHIESLSLRSI
jgi:nucleoside-diphosphate-sugar epimerase